MFEKTSESHPKNVYVHHNGDDWTYAEVRNYAKKIASWLSTQGLKKGDRVGLLISNSIEYVSCYFGVLAAGGIVVGLNPDTTPRELSGILSHCEPFGIVVGPKTEPILTKTLKKVKKLSVVIHTANDTSLQPYVKKLGLFSDIVDCSHSGHFQPPELDDVAQLIYTSGTTGRPKGITLSHRSLLANCFSIIDYLQLTSKDRVLVILPFFYSYGNSLLLTHTAVGGGLALASDFVFWNRILDLMESQKVTGFSGVPSSYAMLLNKTSFASRSFSELRYLTCAGGGLAPRLVKRLRSGLPKLQLYLMYGQTEAAARLSTLMPEDIERKPNSIGKGIPGVTLRVCKGDGSQIAPGETGEIVAQGDNLMLGYWRDPEETQKVLRPNGLYTGDLATVDEEGYLYIVGRKSDLIKSGAYRISPKEIEDVLLELTQIVEVAVVGEPDETIGEMPVAYVVKKQESEDLTEKRVIDYCLKNLPRYKAVKKVYFVPTLPKTSSGKVRRVELGKG